MPLALTAWASALGCVLIPSLALPLAVAAAAVTVGWVALLRSRRRVSAFVLLPLCVAVVAAHVAMLVPGRDLAQQRAVGRHVTLTVHVTSKVEPAWPGAWRFSGDADGVVGSAASTNEVAGPVTVVFAGERTEALDLGATVEVAGTARAPRAGERAVLAVRAAAEPIVTAPPAGLFGITAKLRQHFLAVATTFPGTGGALLPGLAVGDTSAVDDELDTHMRVASLSHLTAVSGANCAVVVGAVFALAALCRFPRSARVVLSLLALAGFVMLVTPEPSVIRAAAMAALAMLTVLLGRSRSGVGLLCSAVTLLVMTDPWLACSVGFILSIAATSALLMLAEPISRRLEAWLPRAASLALAVPIAAQLVCAPILVLLTPAVSVYGIPANLICAPVATFATVAGLLACLSAAIPGVGFALTAVAWVPAQVIATTARLTAGLPGAERAWSDGLVGFLTLASLSAAVIVLLIRVHRGPVRTSAALVIALALGIGAGSWGVRAVIVPLATPGDWVIAACDVGQGDAVLVRSGDEVALIDTGPDPAALGECLHTLGVTRLSLLVLTHFDADHAGGTAAVVGRVQTVLHGPVEPEDAWMLAALTDGGADVRDAQPGMTGVLAEAGWRVHWPPPGEGPGNDASVVISFEGGGIPRSVYLGDLGADAQQRLQAAHTLQSPYAVAKVAHHGSADQWPRLYEALGAHLALVTVGADNDYDHPRPETLAMLTRLGVATARTDTAGLVLVGTAPTGALTLWCERDCAAATDEPSPGR